MGDKGSKGAVFFMLIFEELSRGFDCGIAREWLLCITWSIDSKFSGTDEGYILRATDHLRLREETEQEKEREYNTSERYPRLDSRLGTYHSASNS